MELDMYAEAIITNYEHPTRKRAMEHPDFLMHDYNPLCGDEITVYVSTDGTTIKDVTFEGAGCAISMGTANMLAEALMGRPLEELRSMNAGSIIELIGVDPGPVRLKCAVLSLKALQKGLALYERKRA